MMKYAKGLGFFMVGFLSTTAVFYLGLIFLGESFENAAPLVTDGFFIAWAITSLIAGSLALWISVRRQ
jgi:hypothetical protein